MDPTPIESVIEEPEPGSDPSSTVMRVGTIVAGGVVAAAASSLPAALRLDAGSGILTRWLVLCALFAPVGVIAVAVLRRARVGLRLVAGARADLFAMGVLWWLAAELVLLSGFGAVLRKTTHHHALAGVTFAVFAVGSGAVVGLLVRRLVQVFARDAARAKVGLALGGAALLTLALASVRASGADVAGAALLVDALAFAVAAAIASSRLLSGKRAIAVAGVPAAVLVMVVGFSMLRGDGELRGALDARAPLHAAVTDLIER